MRKDLLEALLATNTFLTVFIGHNYHTFYGAVQIAVFILDLQKFPEPQQQEVS